LTGFLLDMLVITGRVVAFDADAAVLSVPPGVFDAEVAGLSVPPGVVDAVLAGPADDVEVQVCHLRRHTPLQF